MLTVPGVQRYIAAARTTGDLTSGSRQIAALSAAAAEKLSSDGARVIFGIPEPGSVGGPNRVVALVPSDPEGATGALLAQHAADAVAALWTGWLSALYPVDTPSTPGFPEVQWVCIPPSGSYARQYLRAQETLAARRRVRTFTSLPATTTGRHVCSVSARWPAVPNPPARARSHEQDERLSALLWAKRMAPHASERPRTPSMASIATAPFRRHVLEALHRDDVGEALSELAAAATGLGHSAELPVPDLGAPDDAPQHLRRPIQWLIERGGPWVDPNRWTANSVRDETTTPLSTAQAHARALAGRSAAARLADAMSQRPGGYLAVIVQDLDDMGLFLSGEGTARDGSRCQVSVERHQAVAALLPDVAAAQMAGLRPSEGSPPLHAVPVYLGGDDLLVLAPAATALLIAHAVHAAVPHTLPTSSAAVLFVSQHAGLQPAVQDAHVLLEEAKGAAGKDRLAVGYQRRSGSAHRTVQRWSQASDILHAFTGAVADLHGLSPQIVADLQRETPSLRELHDEDPAGLVDAEIRRLVDRHLPDSARGSDAAHTLAAALSAAGAAEGARFDPVPAARVAMFLAGEAQ